MTENGATIPQSSFYNCSGPGILPCEVELNYGTNTIYDLISEATIYFWDGCDGPCSVTVGPSANAEVLILYPAITSLSQTKFYTGQSGTLSITGSNLTTPFQNPPDVQDVADCFSSPGLSVESFEISEIALAFSVPTELSPDSLACFFDTLAVSNDFGIVEEPISVTATPPSINGSDGNPVNSSQSSPIQVLAGQQILLSVAAPAGGTRTLESQSWSFGNSADVVGGYNATGLSGTGQVVPVSGADQASLPPIYFIVPGRSETVTVNVTYDTGEQASSTAYFYVDGPTSVSVTNYEPVAPVHVWANPDLGGAYIELGTGTQSTYGIVLEATASHLPSNFGSNAGFQWVQLVNVDTLNPRESGVPQPTTCQTSVALPALDGQYPDYSGEYFSDSPAIPLGSSYGEIAGGDTLTTYLMWDPALPDGCVRSEDYQGNCSSIPIPLGTLTWSWSGDAINTRSPQNPDNGTTFSQSCGSEAGDATNFVQGSTFPTWNAVYPIAQPLTKLYTCSPPLQ